jgi:hypothetical protein
MKQSENKIIILGHICRHVKTPFCDAALAKSTVKYQQPQETYAKHPHNLNRDHYVFKQGLVEGFGIKRYTPLQPISQLFPFQIMHGSLFSYPARIFVHIFEILVFLFLETFSQQIVRELARNYCEHEHFHFNPASLLP